MQVTRETGSGMPPRRSVSPGRSGDPGRHLRAQAAALTSSLLRLVLLERDFLRRYTEKNLRTVNFFMLCSIAPRPAARSRRARGHASPHGASQVWVQRSVPAGARDSGAGHGGHGRGHRRRHKGQAAPATTARPRRSLLPLGHRCPQLGEDQPNSSAQSVPLPPINALRPAPHSELAPIRVRRPGTPLAAPPHPTPPRLYL